MPAQPSPKELISLLGLEPHPEGGYFKETFRDADTLPNGKRSYSSLIYFLIESGNCSNLHRIDAAEAWHYYAGSGSGIEVIELESSGPKITRLGIEVTNGQLPQYVVPKGRWFGARIPENGGSGSWALVGCTVAPAFDFETFELAKREVLLKEFPACKDVIQALTRDE